jgi:hypothetical protein
MASSLDIVSIAQSHVAMKIQKGWDLTIDLSTPNNYQDIPTIANNWYWVTGCGQNDKILTLQMLDDHSGNCIWQQLPDTIYNVHVIKQINLYHYQAFNFFFLLDLFSCLHNYLRSPGYSEVYIHLIQLKKILHITIHI